jgi:hypothetical protein
VNTPYRLVLVLIVSMAAVSRAHAQSGAETFTATASVKTDSGAETTAPVRIIVVRTMSQDETDPLIRVFLSGGVNALRHALRGVPPTGSVQLGNAAAVATRLTLDRTTDKGRLLTIVADQPILFVGRGLPDARPTEEYDFAVVDLEVDAQGNGSGTLSPTARILVQQGAFVVEDYGTELVVLREVKKS